MIIMRISFCMKALVRFFHSYNIQRESRWAFPLIYKFALHSEYMRKVVDPNKIPTARIPAMAVV